MSVEICAHVDFRADVDVHRIVSEIESTAMVGLSVDVRIVCIACGEPVKFRTPIVGLLPGTPTRSLDATELRAPAWIGDDETLGADLAGFTVTLDHKPSDLSDVNFGSDDT